MHDIPGVEQIHRKKVWRWAARVAHHPPNRWTQRAMNWNPSLDESQQGYRKHGGQQKRWDDDIRKFLKSLHQTTSDAATQGNTNEATRPR
eukprot:3064559-Pyramimonas_sp.AAC.1